MPVIELHRRVAAIGLRATAEHGFALGGGKVCALASRSYERDYADTAAALGRYSVGQMIGFAKRLDPGLTDQDFADAGRRLDRMEDEAFTRYGLTSQDVARLRERLTDWPRVAAQRRAEPDASPEPV